MSANYFVKILWTLRAMHIYVKIPLSSLLGKEGFFMEMYRATARQRGNTFPSCTWRNSQLHRDFSLAFALDFLDLTPFFYFWCQLIATLSSLVISLSILDISLTWLYTSIVTSMQACPIIYWRTKNGSSADFVVSINTLHSSIVIQSFFNFEHGKSSRS